MFVFQANISAMVSWIALQEKMKLVVKVIKVLCYVFPLPDLGTVKLSFR